MTIALAPIPFGGSIVAHYRHVCVFFSSPQEEYQTLLPFVVEGLQHGERAFQKAWQIKERARLAETENRTRAKFHRSEHLPAVHQCSFSPFKTYDFTITHEASGAAARVTVHLKEQS